MSTTTNLTKAAERLSELYRNAGKTTTSSEEIQILISKRFMSRLAEPLLQQLGITKDTQEPLQLLDLACGSGVVVQEIQETLAPEVLEKSSFLSSDNSQALVDLVNKRIVAEQWTNTNAQVLNAMDTGLPENHFNRATVSMGLHLIPQPDDTIRECMRVLKSGGLFGATTPHDDQDYSMWQPDIRSAFASFPFEAPFPERFPTQMHDQGRWADPEWIKTHLQTSGLKDVEVKVARGTYWVDNADNFLMTFGGMLAWVSNAWWSEETRTAHPLEEIKGLVKKHLEERYEGKGWELRWGIVCATGKVEK